MNPNLIAESFLVSPIKLPCIDPSVDPAKSFRSLDCFEFTPKRIES